MSYEEPTEHVTVERLVVGDRFWYVGSLRTVRSITKLTSIRSTWASIEGASISLFLEGDDKPTAWSLGSFVLRVKDPSAYSSRYERELDL